MMLEESSTYIDINNVSNGWYLVYGFYNFLMVSLGMWLWYIYQYSISSQKSYLQPYLQWKYESLAFMASYSSVLLMWILNILFDHNGGWFDRFFYNISYLNQVMPYITLYGVFNASSSYGTEKQVNSNTQWALTVNSDSNY